MDHAARPERQGWQYNGELDDEIASIKIAQLDWLTVAVRRLFERDHVPDAGIVISNDPRLASAGRIEKNCYNKGGFIFLVRPGGERIGDDVFPIARLTAVLEGVGDMYMRDILGVRDTRASLASCWAVCQRDGDYGTLHNHIPPEGAGGARYSGMLYLQIPPAISPRTFPCGCLHLITSKGGAIYIPPIAGAVTIWPSQLLHGIHPFRGTGDRLGIAFDLISKKEQ